MIRKYTSMFSPRYPLAIAYMLQSTEYDGKAYMQWLKRVNDFNSVMNRRALEHTKVSQAFILFLYAGIVLQICIAGVIIFFGFTTASILTLLIGLVLLLTSTFIWSYLVLIPLFFAKHLLISRRRNDQQSITKQIMSEHKGTKIAVAGSFGKTTMKELLATVLSEGKEVASTPGNKNVAVAHYDFARNLSGDEEIIIIEFGEGSPGDVASFTETINPGITIITGIAPAHLDQYASVQDAASDIFCAAKPVQPGNVYVNSESEYVSGHILPEYIEFSASGLDGWVVNGAKVDLQGTHFSLTKGNTRINIDSGLIGKHLLGVLSTTAVVAHKLGLTVAQIEAGFQKTVPYEHRMQPYRIGGAWVIDDSYNGNLQGIKAGTELLASLEAKRKIYVTPGLVDQGEDTATIHNEIGRLIADARPDIVVLMQNSVADYIAEGLKSAEYLGEIILQPDPLHFYRNLDQFVASGDIVLLQNDWTDNYQ